MGFLHSANGLLHKLQQLNKGGYLAYQLLPARLPGPPHQMCVPQGCMHRPGRAPNSGQA